MTLRYIKVVEPRIVTCYDIFNLIKYHCVIIQYIYFSEKRGFLSKNGEILALFPEDGDGDRIFNQLRYIPIDYRGMELYFAIMSFILLYLQAWKHPKKLFTTTIDYTLLPM